ncbi:MAG: germination protein YpeB [Eubacteriales bacterium]|nr:germination protein YpeB [Eubacteriales bacterium]MDD3881524.1 germination protein YpeB [Eubacteriales bacterium]MDD4512994.1 germination protein YpeB [Eubacteriales bacterium]
MSKKIKVVVAALAILFLGAAAGLVIQYEENIALKRASEAGVNSAANQMMEDLSAMETAIGKLLVSSDSGMRAGYLAQIARKSEAISKVISFLPEESNGAISGFFNESGAYAYSLVPSVAEGAELEDEDVSQLAQMLSGARNINEKLSSLYSGGVDAGSLLTVLSAAAEENGELSEHDSGISVPRLIFDGAFSDVRLSGSRDNLGSNTISRESAEEVVRAFFSGRELARLEQLADVSGSIPCYGFSVSLPDLELYAEVTVAGGHMLLVMPKSAAFQEILDMPACIEYGREFLKSMNLDALEPTYFQTYNGMAVINFAPITDGVLLYPDLIKLQIRMDTGEVVGYESTNYLLSHKPREFAEVKLSPEDALGLVSSAGESVRLCLIPLRGSERLCYEIGVTGTDAEYLIYIDALTGEEAEILKILPTSGGLLTL